MLTNHHMIQWDQLDYILSYGGSSWALTRPPWRLVVRERERERVDATEGGARKCIQNMKLSTFKLDFISPPDHEYI